MVRIKPGAGPNERHLIVAWWSRARVRCGLAVALVVSIMFGYGLAASTAHAARWMNYVGYHPSGGGIIGTMTAGGYSEQVICVDAGSNLPTGTTSGSPVADAQIGYLMSKYSQTQDDVEGAALAYVVKEKYDTNWSYFINSEFGLLNATTRNQIIAKANELKTEAATYAGGYRIPIKDSMIDPSRGVVSGIEIRTASGSLLSGYRITLVIDAGSTAVWDATGTKTLTVTSGSSTQSATWHATALGNITSVTATTDAVLPSGEFLVHPAAKRGEQKVASQGAPSTATGFDPAAFPIGRYSVSYASETPAKFLEVGAPFEDVTTTTAEEGSAAVGVVIPTTLTVYGPLADAPAAPLAVPPAGTPVFEVLSKDVTLDADGKVTTLWKGAKPITKAGLYIGVESNTATQEVGAASGTFGRPSEFSTRINKIEVRTRVARPAVIVGDQQHDVVTLGNVAAALKLIPGGSVTATGTVLEAPAVNGSCTGVDWSTAVTVAKIGPIVVTTDGVIETPAYTTAEGTTARCGTFAITATVKDPQGAVISTTPSPAGIESETFLILPKPTIHTTISKPTYRIGDQVSDTVEVTDLAAILAAFPGSRAVLAGVGLGLGPQETDWSTGTKLVEIPATTLTQDGLTEGLGAFTATTVGKVSYGEHMVVLAQDGTKIVEVDHPVGQTQQTATVTVRSAGGGGGIIATGEGTNNLALAGVGGLTMLGGAAAILTARRRHLATD